MNEKKLLIIGLDGATFDLIIPWVKEGRLKTFKKLMDGGIWGELESTKPPLTCPAWPSFMTGKNSGKHGVVDFIVEGDNGEKVISLSDIDGEPFWDVAGRQGRRSIIVNVPVTYPPVIKNGILISGMMTPPGQVWCSNDNVMEGIKQIIGNYIVDLDIVTINSLGKKASMTKLYDMMDKRFRTVMYLMQHYPFDLFVCVFKGTDIVAHKLWHKKEEILKTYQIIDMYLEKLTNNNNNIFIISDHGFGSFSKGVCINQYLFTLGLLKKRQATSDDGFTHGFTTIQKLRFGSNGDMGFRTVQSANRLFFRLGLTRDRVAYALRKIGAYEWVMTNFPKLFKRMLPSSRTTVDRSESKAFLHSTRTRSIVVNKKFFNTISDYENFLTDLRYKLLNLKDPETGSKVLSNVFRREEIYSGKYVDRLPDLYLELADGYLIRGDFGERLVDSFPAPRPDHCANGILIGYGPDITKAKQIYGSRIIDLAPTFLHLLGEAVPEDFDGRVLYEVFSKDSEAFRQEVRYCHSSEKTGVEEVNMSLQQENELKDALRGLGYIE